MNSTEAKQMEAAEAAFNASRTEEVKRIWEASNEEDTLQFFSKNGIKPINGDEFLAATLPKPQWIIADFIARNMKGDLCASSKVKKTFLAIQLAASIAAGVDFLGKFPIDKPHIVAYFDLELFDWNFQERLKAMTTALGIKPTALARLKIFNLRNNAAVLRNDERLDTFVEYLEARGVEMVIIDPRYKILKEDEDENTAQGLRGVLHFRDKLAEHFAVMLVVHDPKGATAEKKATDRGAGSYTGGADFDFRLIIDRASSWSNEEETFVIGTETRARCAVPDFGVRFERGCFIADEEVRPIRLGAKTTATTDPKAKAEMEADKQTAFRAAALRVVEEAGDRLLSIEQFNARTAATPGGAGGVNKRNNMRKALIKDGVLAWCYELERKPSGGVGRKKNGDTLISTPQRIEAYKAKFDTFDI